MEIINSEFLEMAPFQNDMCGGGVCGGQCPLAGVGGLPPCTDHSWCPSLCTVNISCVCGVNFDICGIASLPTMPR